MENYFIRLSNSLNQKFLKRVQLNDTISEMQSYSKNRRRYMKDKRAIKRTIFFAESKARLFPLDLCVF